MENTVTGLFSAVEDEQLPSEGYDGDGALLPN